MRWKDAGNGEEKRRRRSLCLGGWVLSWVNLISPDSHVATTSYPTSESKQTQPQQAVVTPAAHRGAQDSICFPQWEPQHFRVSRPRHDASKSFLLFPFWGHRSKLTHTFTLTLVIITAESLPGCTVATVQARPAVPVMKTGKPSRRAATLLPCTHSEHVSGRASRGAPFISISSF